MLRSKLMQKGVTTASTLSFSFNFTNFIDGGSRTYTVPTTGPLVGDLAVLHYTSVQGEMSPTPTGWTQISLTSSTSAGRQIQRVVYKVLTSGDLGSVLTLATTTNATILGTYSKTRLATFTPSKPLTGILVSSLTTDVETNTARTKDTSIYTSPDIVFAASSFYNGPANGGYSETYWNQEYITGSTTQLITAFEIQNGVNTNRTITPLVGGSALIHHSFVLNATT
jgi:hypothetical protein